VLSHTDKLDTEHTTKQSTHITFTHAALPKKKMGNKIQPRTTPIKTRENIYKPKATS